ncbi:MAG: hypothetical protein K1X83_10795 [Oligoflexia bacterium]|nr:hypothetical protein [Oligoflexia bacterium]
MRHGPPSFLRSMVRGPRPADLKRPQPDQSEQTAEELRSKLARALAEMPKPDTAEVDPAEIQAIKDSLQAGKLPDGVDLHNVLTRGSKEQRLALREFFTTPLCAGRNQDLLLSTVRPAIEGDLAAQSHYERERLVLVENLPDWVREQWEQEHHAAWRTIDLFEKRVTIYAGRKFKSSVLPEFRYKRLPAYDPQSFGEFGTEQSADGIIFDVRGALFTMAGMRELCGYLDTECKLSAQRLGAKLFPLMKAEVELGLQLLLSPTIVGVLFRERAQQEMTALFAAFLIEDAVLAYDLPASPRIKLSAWRTARFHPWQLRNVDLLKHGEFVARELRRKLNDPDEIMAQFEEILSSPQAIRRFRKNIFRPQDKETGGRTGTGTDLIAPRPFEYEPPRNRRLEIQAALESYRRLQGEERRYARAFAKLVGDSDAVQSRVMFAIENEGDLDQLVIELRADRPLSVLNADLDLELEAVSPEEAQRVRLRLFGAEGLVKERPRIGIRHTPESLDRLRDGRIRHAVERVLEKFVEKPELADIKPLVLAPGVWEIREHSTGARVYYLPTDQEIVILLVGSKPNQVADVSLLPKLRDRECPVS